LLRRILRHLCAAFCAALDCPAKVILRQLQVMTRGDRLRIANPSADDMDWERFGQFRLSCTAEILERFGPGGEARLADDAFELGARIGVAIAVSSNHEFGKGCRGVKRRCEDWS